MPPLNPFGRSCIALAIGQTLILPAGAATIEVDDPGDPGSDDSMCTLREAIITVNTGTDNADQTNTAGCYVSGSLGPTDTITFNAASMAATGGTITLTESSQLRVTNAAVDITVQGLGRHSLTIDGNNYWRPRGGVFHFESATFTIDGLTITGGSATSGGGIYAWDVGNSRIINSTLTGNSATGSSRGGGGIFFYGSNLSIVNSTIAGNFTSDTGGGLYASGNGTSEGLTVVNSAIFGNSAGLTGGGVFTGEMSVVDSTVTDNWSGDIGGGIRAINATVVNSMLSGNTAVNEGGAMWLVFGDLSTVLNSTISANRAGSYGGGIYIKRLTGSMRHSADLRIENSTLSGNYAGFAGGGVYAKYSLNVHFLNSTLTGNEAGVFGGGLYANTIYSTSLDNNIFSGNRAAVGISTGHDIFRIGGALPVTTGNVFSDAINGAPGNAITGVAASNSDYLAQIPVSNILDTTLADNECGQPAGDPETAACVETHALVTGSPAISLADDSRCPGEDQRGEQRNIPGPPIPIVASNGNIAVIDLGGDCDAGAFEL